MSPMISKTDLPLVGETFAIAGLSGPAIPYEFTDKELSTARAAVMDYLKDGGCHDPECLATESQRILQQAQVVVVEQGRNSGDALMQTALQLAMNQVRQSIRIPSVVPRPEPAEMRKQTMPLVSPVLKRVAALVTGEEIEGADGAYSRPPARHLSGWVWPRITLTLLSLASTVVATWVFVLISLGDGFGLLDIPVMVLFSLLFLWVAFSFWTATLGLVSLLRYPPATRHPEASSSVSLPPTVILMPVYNEAPESVFANLKAIVRSLHETDHGQAFDVFALSDSTKPEVWLAEEQAWLRLASEFADDIRVYYRHRPKNKSRKAGNIADFCTRWGQEYKYMIVLDADSVMAGETLVELVRRMEHDPQLGILQAPPQPVNRQSLFARMQQFASRVYGPVFLEGFALWSQCEGNYWGHNAIIRIAPFMEYCDLPKLPGEGPLSGEILSHDFVEAALMRRAGWKVCLAHDLQGSYEECPTTMLDFAQRDQRWCQGNLQHIRLLLAEGLHPASRLHLGMGAMSYLASPLWLIFLLLTLLGAFTGGAEYMDQTHGWWRIGLFALSMTMLLLPKLWGVIALSGQRTTFPGDRIWHGAFLSVLLETIVSMLVAPIMMLLHSQFVTSTLCGRKVTWNAQQRDDRGVTLRDATTVHGWHTVVGVLVGLAVWYWMPGMLPWLAPVLLGLVLSIPLSMILGNVQLGKALRRGGLLLIPEELALPQVLQYQREALDEKPANQAPANNLWKQVLHDPCFHALHMTILQATNADTRLSKEEREELEACKLEQLVTSANATLGRSLLSDVQALGHVHLQCWKMDRQQ